MKCFVGLGNPGKPYSKNRHNVGFMVIDQFARQFEVTSFQQKGHSEITELHHLGEKIILVKPMTYMNLSGEAVRATLQFFKVSIEDVVIIYDDLDTQFGQIRLRFQGNSGGHNGIKSIISQLNTLNFNRIRVGISRPLGGSDIAEYVLSDFSKQEELKLPEVLQKCCLALEHAIAHPFEITMGKYNSSSHTP